MSLQQAPPTQPDRFVNVTLPSGNWAISNGPNTPRHISQPQRTRTRMTHRRRHPRNVMLERERSPAFTQTDRQLRIRPRNGSRITRARRGNQLAQRRRTPGSQPRRTQTERRSQVRVGAQKERSKSRLSRPLVDRLYPRFPGPLRHRR